MPHERQQELLGRIEFLVARKRTWSEIAMFIVRVEQSEAWREEKRTFSDWIAHVAEKLDLQQSNLWRYRSSANYAFELFGLDISQPDEELIAELNKTSAENLELLSKLSRVAPESVFKGLVEHVLAGTLTRTRLRETWDLFKPALGGRTAQGRAKSAPKIDIHNLKDRMAVQHAASLISLANAGSQWLRQDNVVTYKLLQLVRPKREISGHSLDAVILVRTADQDNVELHGIKVLDSLDGASSQSENAKYCDCLWLVVAFASRQFDVPDGVGVVRVTDDGPVVLAEARRTGRDGLVGQLARTVIGLLV